MRCTHGLIPVELMKKSAGGGSSDSGADPDGNESEDPDDEDMHGLEQSEKDVERYPQQHYSSVEGPGSRPRKHVAPGICAPCNPYTDLSQYGSLWLKLSIVPYCPVLYCMLNLLGA